MARIKISYGNSRLIALLCEAEKDLGTIDKYFYNAFRTPDRCPYIAQCQESQLRTAMMTDQVVEKMSPAPRPCKIYTVNGGRPVPYKPKDYARCHESDKSNRCPSPDGERKSAPQNVYYYDFAVIGECVDVDVCLDIFLKRMGLREVESSSTYMSDDELCSLMRQWWEGALTSQ